MTDTSQLKIWKSQFGRAYTNRNIVKAAARIQAFKKMVGPLKLKNILEIGCSRGHNLVALSRLGHYQLIGIEPLEYAVKKARTTSQTISVIEGDCFNIPFIDSYFDLVFSCGVLIHIAKKDLGKAISEMNRVSKKYLLSIEYYSPKDTVIDYRGHNNLLWKRDFKKYFLQYQPNLKLIKQGFWNQKQGFDNCHWWLFKKTNSKT